jgi:uncharacterized protein (TIGR02594 family)
MENAEKLAELKARLLAVIDSYKQFNKELPAELKATVNQVLGPQTTDNKDGKSANPITTTTAPLTDNSANTANFIKQFGNVTPSSKAQGAKDPKQLAGLKSQMGNINDAAQKHGINPALIAGMMSRETGGEEGFGYKSLKEFGITPKAQLDIMQGKLKSQGAEAHQLKQDEFVLLSTSPLSKFPGLNDTEKCWGDGKAQGYGPMQLDYGYNSSKILKVLMKSTAAERDTAAIDTCTGLLATYLKMMKKKYPQATEAQQLKAAMAAYNKGPNVDINNPDSGTAGGDYSKDVVERMTVLQGTDLFKGGANPNPTQNPTQDPAKNPATPATPVVASKTLSGSVGEGGKNNPADVLLVKTLLNKFTPSFNLTDVNTNTKVGPTTIGVIKKFQQEKVGLTKPDGLIDVGGKTWKTLNGENPPVAPTTTTTTPAGNGNGAKPAWISKAESFKGLKERDAKNYETIHNFFKSCGLKFGDGGIVSPTATAWCAAFVSFCLKNSGQTPLSGYAGVRALEYAKFGQATKDNKPAFGCIGVMSHGHVGFVVGRNGDNIALLGGNQGQECNISNYSIGKFSAFRFPAGYNPPAEAYNLNGVDAGEGGSTR